MLRVVGAHGREGFRTLALGHQDLGFDLRLALEPGGLEAVRGQQGAHAAKIGLGRDHIAQPRLGDGAQRQEVGRQKVRAAHRRVQAL